MGNVPGENFVPPVEANEEAVPVAQAEISAKVPGNKISEGNKGKAIEQLAATGNKSEQLAKVKEATSARVVGGINTLLGKQLVKGETPSLAAANILKDGAAGIEAGKSTIDSAQNLVAIIQAQTMSESFKGQGADAIRSGVELGRNMVG